MKSDARCGARVRGPAGSAIIVRMARFLVAVARSSVPRPPSAWRRTSCPSVAAWWPPTTAPRWMAPSSSRRGANHDGRLWWVCPATAARIEAGDGLGRRLSRREPDGRRRRRDGAPSGAPAAPAGGARRGDRVRRCPWRDTGAGTLALAPSSVLRVAGAADNIFKALQTLPGVSATDDFGSRLAVRGGGPIRTSR